tara:strand:- start:97 stop:198 length:102 start_codon:yes stop_codon:yes gene_type:complete
MVFLQVVNNILVVVAAVEQTEIVLMHPLMVLVV